MKKFLLLIREDLNRLSQMSPQELEQDIQTMTQWVEELAKFNTFIAGEPLESEARIVSKNHVSSDGPFIEANEGISGYFIIQAETLDQAVEIAAECPHVVEDKISIEVRPIMEMIE